VQGRGVQVNLQFLVDKPGRACEADVIVVQVAEAAERDDAEQQH